MCSLTLVDGLQQGWIEVLLDPNEYLRPPPNLRSLDVLSSFTHFIAFGPGVRGDLVLTTHVAGHPPPGHTALLLLGRSRAERRFLRLGHCALLVAPAASVVPPVTMRDLGAEGSGRRIVPFVALAPRGLDGGVGRRFVCRGGCRWAATVLGLRGRTLASLVGFFMLGTAGLLPPHPAQPGRFRDDPDKKRGEVACPRNVAERSPPPGPAGRGGPHLAPTNWWMDGCNCSVRAHYQVHRQRPFSYFTADPPPMISRRCQAGMVRSIAALSRGRRTSDAGPDRSPAGPLRRSRRCRRPGLAQG